jgi:flotillin
MCRQYGAEAKANATQMQLEAEAEGTKRKLLAEAEGKRASLMAEADKITAVEMAPAKAVEKMIECGMTPQTIVQYKTVDQLKGIAEASAEMYEHIHLGQVTVYGNENTAGSFMAKTAENLNPAFELLKSIPFKKTFKEMFVEDKKDNPTEDNFEAVK